MNLALRSVRLRLTVWYAGALAIMIFIFSLGIYFFVHTRLMRQLDRQLDRDFATVVKSLSEGAGELEEIEEHGAVALFQVSEKGQLVYRSLPWLTARLEKVLPENPSQGRESLVNRAGRRFRLRVANVAEAEHTYSLLVARSEEVMRQSLQTLALILVIGFPIALTLALVGGYFLAGRLLSPVGAMASKAQEITADRLSERLPVENRHDELGRLALAFNETLARLQDAFERLRRFTADASHELRTPLTALRSVGEVGLQDDLDAAGYREVIGSMLEETDRLSHLVDNLLTLTRADTGKIGLNRQNIDLEVLANETAEHLQVLAEEKQQTLTIHADDRVDVKANRTTLRQALVNLLDNAIRYTPAEGRIEIHVRRLSHGEAILEVRDDGPGISKDQYEKMFERFYRGEAGHESQNSGAGLGLAIARWAVEVNGGRIEVESAKGRGSTFRVALSAQNQ